MNLVQMNALASVDVVQGQHIYETNSFISGMIDVMQRKEVRDFFAAYAKSELCWKTMAVYATVYMKIQKFYDARNKPLTKEMAAYLLYLIMTRPALRTVALRSTSRPLPKAKKGCLCLKDVDL